MNWLLPTIYWYIFIFILGLVFYPLTKKIFKKFPFDQGYAFSKTLAIIFLSYFTFLLGIIKILPFERNSLIFLISIFIFFNFIIVKKTKNKSFNWKNLLINEILFFTSFIFWTFIRGQEPSIRSLEKFMDFGFINSILRSRFFPPLDMWYPPEAINYYYFGHLSGAVLIKLTNIKPAIGYNLILSTIFALGITQTFSLLANILVLFQNHLKKINLKLAIFISLLGSYLVNLGGNLHTIYILTKGYPNENPIPFWQIISPCNTLFPQICQKLKINLIPYWYPNATRFIPYTIHEFPSYSYVVADLHGHVFDIPFVLLTITVFLTFLLTQDQFYLKLSTLKKITLKKIKTLFIKNIQLTPLLFSVFIGFLTAVHYMTNAFDGPIYLLLTMFIFLTEKNWVKFLIQIVIVLISFIIFSLPFSLNFKPFVSGIGVNCGSEIFNYTGKIGLFLFEKGNCQSSPLWMLFLLWGFFWLNFLFYLLIINNLKKKLNKESSIILNFIFILFLFSTFLIIIPEFFYIKDIYPAHFRANTMFKLGYQAFIMMAIASAFILFLIKFLGKNFLLFFYFFSFIFVFIYPFYSIPSYYGQLNKKVELDGSLWLKDYYPEDKEIVDWLNKNVKHQPIILEAQGDSYTDYERISANTGLPTVAGWWVHEWLWRGSADFVGNRIPDIVNIYESKNISETLSLLKKYNVKYVIISTMEKQKYLNLNEKKFKVIGKEIFRSSNKNGAIYQINY